MSNSRSISFPIETDTIGLIQSQTIQECGPDAIQHMLFFADGFREFWAYNAREIFWRHPIEILTANFGIIEPEILDFDFPNLNMTRRYVLKKLENCGYNARRINDFFRATVIPTWRPPLLKSVSINVYAGTKTAASMVVPSQREHFHYKFADNTRFIGETSPLLSIKDIQDLIKGHISSMPSSKELFQMSRYKGTLNSIDDHFITAVILFIKPADREIGHFTSFISFRGKLYYCDNEIGRGIEINSWFDDYLQSGKVNINLITIEVGRHINIFYDKKYRICSFGPTILLETKTFNVREVLVIYRKSDYAHRPAERNSCYEPPRRW